VRTVKTIGLAVLLAIAVAACSSGGAGSPSPTEAPSAAAPDGTTGAVSIVDFGFEPADLTVAAGTTVTWTNTGAATHTVKWSDGAPESTGLTSGATYQRTFDTAGSFPYVCGIHGSMSGTITVTE
jgi:plastocyanin